MTETEHVNRILCCYLRALSVRVSHHRVQRLLDTPVGGSLRGMSDALDALGVRNEVYQLPSREYFAQLEAPFIVGTDAAKRPFRAVTAVTDSEVVFADEKGKKRRMPTERFLSHWTGTVLLGEVTEETVSDPYARWKDVWFGCLKYKWLFGLLGVCLLGLATLYAWDCPPAGYACFFTEVFGMWVAAAILYKEHFDSGFLDRFCHIGQAVDCNRVLQSRGATLLGTGLGEWAMLYFTVFFLLGLMCPVEAYALTAAGCVAALGFTLYSVAYQAFVVRKACMLCLCVNVAVWGQATTLYALRDEVPFVFSPMGMAVFLLCGFIPWNMFKDALMRCMTAVRANQALLTFPQVTELDLMIARLIVVWGTQLLCAGILLSIAAALGEPVELRHPESLAATLFVAPLLGWGVGLAFASLARFWSTLERLVPILMRILFFVSGLFFQVSELPARFSTPLLYNPVAQIIEWQRAGFSASCAPLMYSIGYILAWCFASISLGLLLERYARGREIK